MNQQLRNMNRQRRMINPLPGEAETYMGTVKVANPWPRPITKRPAISIAWPEAAVCRQQAANTNAEPRMMKVRRPHLMQGNQTVQSIIRKRHARNATKFALSGLRQQAAHG